MMNLDYNTIGQIIKDVDKSINEHLHAIDLFYTDCGCSAPEQVGKCFNCRVKELIDDLSCLKSHLEPLSKNTVNSIHFVDVESFCYSIGKMNNIDSIDIEPIWEDNPDPNSDPNPDQTPDPDQKPIGFEIFIKTSRYAMDGNGFHVGYENVTYKWKAYSKRELGIFGIPYLLSAWVVNPNEYEIESREFPPEDVPYHESDCEFKDDNEDDFCNCDCADMFEGYFHPDDDFLTQEIESIIEQCNWIEAEFNSETREWNLGYTSFNVGEYQTDKDYAESCNEDDGMPSFGNYA